MQGTETQRPRLRLLLPLLTFLPIVLVGCSDDEAPAITGPQVPEIRAICGWIYDLGGPATTGELTVDSLPAIREDAEIMAARGRRLQLPTGEGTAALANASQLLEFIRDAAIDESGLVSIPTYRQFLEQRLSDLLDAIREAYVLSPREAPCSGYAPDSADSTDS